jgi:hypothetical protein
MPADSRDRCRRGFTVRSDDSALVSWHPRFRSGAVKVRPTLRVWGEMLEVDVPERLEVVERRLGNPIR